MPQASRAMTNVDTCTTWLRARAGSRAIWERDAGSSAVPAGYTQRSGVAAADGDDAEYNLGVEVRVGAFKLSAGYAASKTKNIANTAKSSGFGFGGTYSLGKRTRVYAGYSKVEEKTLGKVTGENTILALGVRHDF